jgi:luciferase family oxidoreductase group 1
VVIGYLAEGTSKIRIGSGGIMLPNHAPIVIAEQFGTLESLYPGRIDLGLGRAPGSDRTTMMAMRRGTDLRGGEFDELIEELEFFFAEPEPQQKIKAVPGAGLNVPLYILGSSLYSAHLAAKLGRPYAFAGHFAPAQMLEAFEVYRREFVPSKHLSSPYVMVGVPVVAAATDREAERLATTLYQTFLNLIRGNPRLALPPIDSMEGLWSPMEEMHVRRMLEIFVSGGPERVRAGLDQLIALTGADELIISSNFYDDQDRRRSYEIVAQVMNAK